MLVFLIKILAFFTGLAGGGFLFVYLFIDRNKKQYKRNGIILFVTGFTVVLLVSVLEVLYALK